MLRSQLLTLPWRFLKPSLKSMLVNESQLWKYFHIHCEPPSYTLFSPSQKSPKRKIQRPNSQFSSGLVNHTHTQFMVSGSACNCPLYFRHATTSGGKNKAMQKYPTLKSLNWASPLCLCSWQITWRSASKKWTLEYSFCCYLTLIIRYLCLWDSKTSEGHVGSTFIHLLYKSIC